MAKQKKFGIFKRLLFVVIDLCKAKVSNFNSSFLRYEQILRFEVSIDNILGMEVNECIHDFSGINHCLWKQQEREGLFGYEYSRIVYENGCNKSARCSSQMHLL